MTATKEKGKIITDISVLDQIQTRLNQIEPKNYISPEDTSSGEKLRHLGRLSDNEKRLWTLLRQLQKEMEPVLESIEHAQQIVAEAFGQGVTTPKRILAAAQRVDVIAAVPRVDQLLTALRPTANMYKIVTRIFWDDVRTKFDVWGAGKLYLDNDWNVWMYEQDEDAMSYSLGDLVKTFFG